MDIKARRFPLTSVTTSFSTSLDFQQTGKFLTSSRIPVRLQGVYSELAYYYVKKRSVDDFLLLMAKS